MDGIHEEPINPAPEVHQQPTPPPSDSLPGLTERRNADNHRKGMDVDEETTAPDILSPISGDGDKQEEHELPALTSTDLGSPSMGYDFSNIRVRLHYKNVRSSLKYTNIWRS
jgi:hypothetical protein